MIKRQRSYPTEPIGIGGGGHWTGKRYGFRNACHALKMDLPCTVAGTYVPWIGGKTLPMFACADPRTVSGIKIESGCIHPLPGCVHTRLEEGRDAYWLTSLFFRLHASISLAPVRNMNRLEFRG